MEIDCIAGARPNFIKVAPILTALRAERGVSARLIHTGQHYDYEMSRVFFEDLQLPEPDEHLGVGSGTHAEQTARGLERYDAVLERRRPDWVVVLGDVNSTLACALAAVKRGIPTAHVEAGMRSRDRAMPEEINRIATDAICHALFTTTELDGEILAREGIPPERIFCVGNVMVDVLLAHLDLARSRKPWEVHGVRPGEYALVTLHRAGNVDECGALEEVLGRVAQVGRRLPVLFPVHPRTRKAIAAGGLQIPPGVQALPPLRYIEFIGLEAAARVVVTDSGGMQAEAAVLRVPCITMRPSTEWEITLRLGTNRLVGWDARRMEEALEDLLAGRWPPGKVPDLWDGRTAGRIAEVLVRGRPASGSAGNPAAGGGALGSGSLSENVVAG